MTESIVIAPPRMGAQGSRGRLKSYWELSKPGITRLVLVTTGLGACIAPGSVDWDMLWKALLGTCLVVAGANALNMWLEADSDALMARTQNRPLPSGRLTRGQALGFGLVTATVGLLMLALWVNTVATLLAAAALLSYVAVYTPLKRVTPLALHVGAVPGAMPPVIGWAAATGSVNVQALALFGILFVWQLPHFAAISVFREQEYARAGMRVLSVARSASSVRWAIVRYSAWMLAVSLVPPIVGLGGTVYFFTAVFAGLAFLLWAVMGLRVDSTPKWARSLFFVSMPYLVILLSALALSAH